MLRRVRVRSGRLSICTNRTSGPAPQVLYGSRGTVRSAWQRTFLKAPQRVEIKVTVVLPKNLPVCRPCRPWDSCSPEESTCFQLAPCGVYSTCSRVDRYLNFRWQRALEPLKEACSALAIHAGRAGCRPRHSRAQKGLCPESLEELSDDEGRPEEPSGKAHGTGGALRRPHEATEVSLPRSRAKRARQTEREEMQQAAAEAMSRAAEAMSRETSLSPLRFVLRFVFRRLFGSLRWRTRSRQRFG